MLLKAPIKVKPTRYTPKRNKTFSSLKTNRKRIWVDERYFRINSKGTTIYDTLTQTVGMFKMENIQTKLVCCLHYKI